MRIIKLALISAVVLFGVIYLFSLMIPSQVRISRATNIAVPKDSLRAVVTNLQTWQKWNELAGNEELTNKQFMESSITSDQLKIIKTAVVGDTLFTDWQQQNARLLKSGLVWVGEDNRLVLQWYFDIKLRWYPWEKFGSIVFDKQLGPSMEKSLANLKNLVENHP